MSINNTNIIFRRQLDLSRFSNRKSEYHGTSAFLFGPRMTGKTTILRLLPNVQHSFDLLNVDEELRYKSNPQLFWQELQAIGPGKLIVVDEIQRCPELLNFVQKAMEELQQQFILSGSSARKLRRGMANLLGGRAVDLRLYPLTVDEVGGRLDCETMLQFGSLPRIATLVSEKKPNVARDLLSSYVSTYLKEEIQAEALVRNLGNFQRFLSIAAQANAQMIEFSTIGRDCGVSASTVKDFYGILEDTLLGQFNWPLDRSERKKARPRFYFFDCGVLRALQNRLVDPPTPSERGFLFETWFFNQLVSINHYERRGLQLSLWRHGKHEIDLVIAKSEKPLLAFELKTGQNITNPPALRSFRDQYPRASLYIVSLDDKRSRVVDEVKVILWREAIELVKGL